jgi:hypothetical protein
MGSPRIVNLHLDLIVDLAVIDFLYAVVFCVSSRVVSPTNILKYKITELDLPLAIVIQR